MIHRGARLNFWGRRNGNDMATTRVSAIGHRLSPMASAGSAVMK